MSMKEGTTDEDMRIHSYSWTKQLLKAHTLLTITGLSGEADNYWLCVAVDLSLLSISV